MLPLGRGGHSSHSQKAESLVQFHMQGGQELITAFSLWAVLMYHVPSIVPARTQVTKAGRVLALKVTVSKQ